MFEKILRATLNNASRPPLGYLAHRALAVVRRAASPRLFAASLALFGTVDVHALYADMLDKHGVAAMRVFRVALSLVHFTGEI